MKNIIKILLLVSILLVGCSNTKTEKKQNINTNSELPDVWGDELNNVSFAICHDDEVKNYSYQFMSRIEIPENSSVEAVYSGGSFDCEYSIEKTDDSIGDFYRYIIKLTIQNVQFENDEINVDSIRVAYDYDKYFDLIPDEFTLRRFEGDIEQEVWYFNNAPLVIPASGNYIRYAIGVEKGFILNEVIVTNDSFKIKNIAEYMNVPISTINATDGWELQFSVEETDRSKYTQYTTSVVFKYTVNGKEYIKDTVGDSVYNPFVLYDNLFEMYYNEVLTKEQ